MVEEEVSMAESTLAKTLSDIVGHLLLMAALPDESLLATENEITILGTSRDLTEEERQILHAVLVAVQKERARRIAQPKKTDLPPH